MNTSKQNISFRLFRTALAAACIAVSVAFGAPAQIGTSNTNWELVGGVLTISGTGDMPTNFTSSGGNNPWYSSRASITGVVIEDGVTTIGQYAFYQYSNLTSVTIGNSVTSIGNSAFNGCTRLTSVTIGNSVTSIGIYAFANCTGLTSLTIPNSVTSTGSYAFYNCTGLTSVTIPNSVTSIGIYAFYNCSGLTSVTIPNSVTSIGTYAFRGTGLTSVTIPNSVTSIGTYAFRGTGLTSLTIGNSVTSIGTQAFYNCTGLKQIINRKETPQTIVANVFDNVSTANVKLFVPASAVEAYKAASVWSNFSGKTAAIPFDDAVAVGQTLTANFDAGYTGDKTITLESSNSAVAEIEDGVIKAKSVGTTIITATLGDGSYFFDVFELKVVKGFVVKPAVANTNLVYTGGEQSAGITENAEYYTVTGQTSGTAATTYTATIALKDRINYDWDDETDADFTLDWSIAKATGNFGSPAAVSATYAPTLKLSDIDLNTGYVWNAPTTALSAGNSQSFAATYTDPSGNYNSASGNIVVNVAKATATATAPTGLTATVGQTLANVTLPTGWAWKEPLTTSVGTAGTQTHKATYTPTDLTNYNVITDIDVSITVTAGTDPIRNTQLASRTLKVQTIGNYIVLENLPQNARVEVYNLQGKLMHSSYSGNSQILRIPVQTKGMYIVRIK